MAIYHFSAKVISRAAGSSALASAAYRSASRLADERLGRDHDFTQKADVVHSEVLLPDGAPARFGDRERLWNAVETAETRKDAQLAREVEFAIPREMTEADGVELARSFVRREFVDRGMVADLAVHWDRGADGVIKPHAHVMLTMREVGEDGFGKKVRDWNRTELLEGWRERWAGHVNARLAELDIEARVDHRSFADRGLPLEPQHKVGPAASRMAGDGLDSERAADHRRIARENGQALIRQPWFALGMITREQATFTERDLAAFVHRHTDGKDQFDRAISAVRATPEMIALGVDARGEARFTSRAMLVVEERLDHSAKALAGTNDHAVSARHREMAAAAAARRGLVLSAEQSQALEHVTGGRGLASVVGYAGSGKSAMLGVAREAWEAEGWVVRGAALSGIAAENLESGSGIASRTLASLEHQWDRGREALTGRDVLVIDEAGMIGSRQMERILSHAAEAGAKVVLVGDPEQLQAIEAGAAFRSIAERHGAVEITEVRRQREDWQRDATRALATGRTNEALDAYERNGHVHAAGTRDQARADLIARWDASRQGEPTASHVILTHTNAEVQELNALARARLRVTGDLGAGVTIEVERGERAFAPGDRLMFLKNERSLGVKNGTLAVVEAVGPQRMAVRLDDGREVAFDLKDYAHVDHGYAATFHKAQGVTVDRAHVLATPGMDRHAAYVGLSRHRDRVELHYGQDDFADRERLVGTLSRDRAKEMASDYAPAFAQRRGIELPKAVQAELARDDALRRHARIVSAIFLAQADGVPLTSERNVELQRSRKALDAFDPHASRDVERAYKADPSIVHEAAEGRTARAVRAMQMEAEIRTDPVKRADRFVDRWTKLDAAMSRAYVKGQMGEMRGFKNQMGEMAKGLERDPQLESILAARKAELGITSDLAPSLGRSLAMRIGYDMGLGKGLGL